jgi:hypothetical protein
MFLLNLTQRYVIIREKTFLPAFFYLLLAGVNPLYFYDLRGSVAAFLVVLCLLILFDTYQKPLSQRNALNMSLVLTLGSLYWAPLLLLFPLFWYGMYWFKSLNFKTFFASLMGLAAVCLFLFAWSIFKDDWTVFVQMLPDWSALWDFRFPPLVTVTELVTNIFLGILFVLSVVQIFMAGVSEKIQARTFLSYLSALAAVIAILFLGQNQWEKEWSLILYVPVSLLFAHYFTLAQRLAGMWLFLFTIVFFLSMFAWQWFSGIGN